MNRSTSITIVVALLLIVAGILYWHNNGNLIKVEVKNQLGETATTTDRGNVNVKYDLIRVSNIQPNQIVKSPLKISGEARGNWFFEASFPVKLLDANGKVIAQGSAKAEGDWMTTNFVPFKAQLTFSKPTTLNGTLVLEKDNPSGLPQNAAELRIPVKFETSATSTQNTETDSAAVRAAKKDLASRLHASESSIIVVSVKAKDWPNSCLGLEKAGQFCAQVIVPGFQVTMEAQGKVHVYRTNIDGSVVAAANQ